MNQKNSLEKKNQRNKHLRAPSRSRSERSTGSDATSGLYLLTINERGEVNEPDVVGQGRSDNASAR